jgi:tetratricopeptide (TPR) repeat protein
MYNKIGRQDKVFDFYSQLTGDALTKNILWKIIHLTGKLGEWDRLIEILEKYLENNKNTEIDIYDILGQSYIKTDQMEKALNIYLKLYDAGKSSEIIIRRIATLYAKLGNLEKAEHFIKKMNRII